LRAKCRGTDLPGGETPSSKTLDRRAPGRFCRHDPDRPDSGRLAQKEKREMWAKGARPLSRHNQFVGLGCFDGVYSTPRPSWPGPAMIAFDWWDRRKTRRKRWAGDTQRDGERPQWAVETERRRQPGPRSGLGVWGRAPREPNTGMVTRDQVQVIQPAEV